MASVQNVKFKLRYDTETNWEANNPLPQIGEPCVAITFDDRLILKLGDGIRNYNDLPNVNILNATEIDLGTSVTSAPTGGTATNLLEDDNVRVALQEAFNRLRDLSGINDAAVKFRHADPLYIVRTSGAQTIADVKTFNSPIELTSPTITTSQAVRADRTVSAGNGLTGGGNLSSDITLTVGTPTTTTVSTTNGVAATSHTHQLDLSGRTLTAGNGVTGGGNLDSNLTFTLGTPSNLSASTANGVTASSHTHNLLTGAAVGLSVSTTNAEGNSANLARSNHTHAVDLAGRTLTAGNGLTGGGTLAANRTFTMGTPGTISEASTNAVTASSHTHALGNPYPTGSFYIQYPNANSNTEATAFPTTGRPATLFGGTWTEQWRGEATFFRTFGTDAKFNGTSPEAGGRTNGLQGDQMQRITGRIGYSIGSSAFLSTEGAFSRTSAGNGRDSGGHSGSHIYFNSANSPDARASALTTGETRARNRGIKVYKRTG